MSRYEDLDAFKACQQLTLEVHPVAEGFEADIVALSLEADIIRLEDAGLITHDWRSQPFGGMVSTSVVAFAVREGNPKNIQDWADLTQPGLEILTPNPKTSGGAMWNILGLYGAAERGHVTGVPADGAGAPDFLLAILQTVTVMDESARDSIVNFEKGVGDLKAAMAEVRGMAGPTGKVGCVGYCLGGSLAYSMACQSDTDASVGYYPVQIDDFLDYAQYIQKPALFHIAEKDSFCPPESQQKIAAVFAKNDKITLHA